MSLVLQSSGGGSVTLQEPTTASNYTITVPASTATMAIDGPAFSAYNNATQSIAQSTFTKISFNTKEFDTNNNFDATTNFRFTPTVAGYYQFSAAMQWTTSQGSAEQVVVLYKNGTFYKYFVDTLSPTYSLAGSCLGYANGSTDYFEIYAYTANATTRTINNGSSYTYFQAVMVRGA